MAESMAETGGLRPGPGLSPADEAKPKENALPKFTLGQLDDWLNESGLDQAQFSYINLGRYGADLTIYNEDLTKDDGHRAKFLRNLKRAFDGLELAGPEDMKYLKGKIKIDDYQIEVCYYGAFECKVVSETQKSEPLSDYEKSHLEAELARIQSELQTGVKTTTVRKYSCKAKI